jgi:hypothetical protein
MTPPRLHADTSWCKKLAGQTMGGKYTLTEYIGAGKIGFVYRAQRSDLEDAIFAVKLTFDSLREGWETEIRKVAQLALVEGVAHFHDLGTSSINSEGRPHLLQYTVWDYIAPGENLNAHLRRVKKVQTAFLVAVLERTLHVLHACHTLGVVRHGDLHAGNILIGDQIEARLDDELKPRAPIFITDFGYGETGAARAPKDDYRGLAFIVNLLLDHIDREKATATDRQIVHGVKGIFDKLLSEPAAAERQTPLALLTVLRDLRRSSQVGGQPLRRSSAIAKESHAATESSSSVGQFQVSEMIGERWDWWKALFVPTVPARTRILALDIPTVVTGPRGCGKTMLFRRLSERWMVECGPVPELPSHTQFAALYVNANDFADAFARFPDAPSTESERRLICYAHLCVLSELLSVESSRAAKFGELPSDALMTFVAELLSPPTEGALLQGEDRLQHYRSELEEIKWKFSAEETLPQFPGFGAMSQHRWLPHFLTQLRGVCAWARDRMIVLFIDDFSLPRVTASMQKILNRVLLQRSPLFLAKIATEASTTFLAEDSSGKHLQDGDDFQLIDIGEEALFLEDTDRLEFLSAVFARRLRHDPRIPKKKATLNDLLSTSGLSKTAFARQLRTTERLKDSSGDVPLKRRGRAAARVHYNGEDIFSGLWSGDTRTMIQLITDVVDNAPVVAEGYSRVVRLPVDAETQDRMFRNRGGEWLMSNTRNEPTDHAAVKRELAALTRTRPDYRLQGTYGEHSKAIVEAFVEAARHLLLGPTYQIEAREVPRMAFRLEIVDEFRVEGLAREIYRDLIRFGLFMRDNRGKSVRGAFVPRLYLRRLLLPYGRLALSKRDSVPLPCSSFIELLLEPDKFKNAFAVRRRDALNLQQIELPLSGAATELTPEAEYDDLGRESDEAAKKRRKTAKSKKPRPKGRHK